LSYNIEVTLLFCLAVELFQRVLVAGRLRSTVRENMLSMEKLSMPMRQVDNLAYRGSCQVPRSVKSKKFVVGFQTARTRVGEHMLTWHTGRSFKKVEVKASYKLEVQQSHI
jgi:hypothetical protein